MDYADVKKAFEQFVDAALMHDEATRTGDYKTGNKAEQRIRSALKYIWHTNPYAIGPLLNHENDNVKAWTAMFWLEFNEEHALKVLGEIANSESFHSHSAKICIEEWGKGNLSYRQWE